MSNVCVCRIPPKGHTDGMRFGGKGKSLPPLYLIAVLALEDDVGNPRDY